MDTALESIDFEVIRAYNVQNQRIGSMHCLTLREEGEGTGGGAVSESRGGSLRENFLFAMKPPIWRLLLSMSRYWKR